MFSLLLRGHVLDVLKRLPAESVDCIVTSPPYFRQRVYSGCPPVWWGGDPHCTHAGAGAEEGSFCPSCGAWFGQLGLEPTVDLYVAHLLLVTAELRRVLKETGVMWWNMGDKYSGSSAQRKGVVWGVPKGSLLLSPYRFAIRAVEQGWILRDVVIWDKVNVVSSVENRLPSQYEPVFMFTKSQKYYFEVEDIRGSLPSYNEEGRKTKRNGHSKKNGNGKSIAGHGGESGLGHVAPTPLREGAGNGASSTHPYNLVPLTTFLQQDFPSQKFEDMNDGHTGAGSSNGGSSTLTAFLPRTEVEFMEVGHPGDGRPDAQRPDIETRIRLLRTASRYDISASVASPSANSLKRVKRFAEKFHLDWLQVVESEMQKYKRMANLIVTKMREKGMDFDDLARATGLPEKTIRMYLRTPNYAAVVPREKEWAKLDAVLGLGDYSEVVPTVLFIKGGPPKPGNVIRATCTESEGQGYTHFAVFPLGLVEPLIRVGCPPGGVVLDPFAGSGTVGVAARRLGRSAILVELSEEYAGIIRTRMEREAGERHLIEKEIP